MSEVGTLERPRREAAKQFTGGGRNKVLLGLAGAVACSGALLLILESHLTFFADEWDFLLERRGSSLGVFLDPHNDHIALAPVAIYKLLLTTFGMGSTLPFHIVSTLIFLLSGVLLFVHLRRRVGDWLALFGTGLILFLGAAWIDLLWSFQIAFSGSIAAGLGALLALDRDDRAGDRIACILLVVSTSFSELGLAFVAGVLVRLLLSREPRARRLYVALVPLALYAVWWLGWGHTAKNSLSLHNVVTSPGYVFDAVSQAMASLFGLATPLSGSGSDPVGLDWGRILLVSGLALAVWRVRRLGRAPRALWVALAIGCAFWFLAAFSAIPVLRPPTNGRYVYPSAIFILLIAAEFLRGVRAGRVGLAIAAAVTVAAVISGLWFLRLGYRENLEPASEGVRARLAAIEVSRQTVDPRLVVLSGLAIIHVGSYLSAVDAFGSPAYSERELASSPEPARIAADQTLRGALGISLGPAKRDSPASSAAGGSASGCRALKASPTGGTGIELHPGEFTLRDRSAPGAVVQLARYSGPPSVSLGALPPGRDVSLKIPADQSIRPWRVVFRGNGQITFCVAGSG